MPSQGPVRLLGHSHPVIESENPGLGLSRIENRLVINGPKKVMADLEWHDFDPKILEKKFQNRYRTPHPG